MITPERPDPQRLARVHAACFPDAPWSADDIASLLDKDGALWVTTPDSAGFVLLGTVPPEGDILTIAVDPAVQREGHATQLLHQLFQLCGSRGIETLFLEVGADNTAARALYEKTGFAEVGRRKGYYCKADGTRQDALILKRTIETQTNPT